jgi:hypothetical protein
MAFNEEKLPKKAAMEPGFEIQLNFAILKRNSEENKNNHLNLSEYKRKFLKISR